MELYLETRKEWRKWLDKNHASSDGVWLVFYKKNSGKQGIRYEEAVEEALCYGWIDSKLKSINKEYYIQNFTPRRKKSKWSRLNMERAERLQREGLMMPAGYAEYRKALENPSIVSENIRMKDVRIPGDLEKALEENEAARINFMNFPASARRLYILWLDSAKRAETRSSRIARIVENSAKNIKTAMM